MGKTFGGGDDELITADGKMGVGQSTVISQEGSCFKDDGIVGGAETWSNLLRNKVKSLAHCLFPVASEFSCFWPEMVFRPFHTPLMFCCSCSSVFLLYLSFTSLIFLLSKWDHIMPILSALHWLPVKLHVDFKIFVLNFTVLHGEAPQNICDLLSAYTSGDHSDLQVKIS